VSLPMDDWGVELEETDFRHVVNRSVTGKAAADRETVRALARRLEGKGTGDAALRAEVEQLHHRLGEVDALQGRVAELEERLDFTERMLARTPEAPAQVLRGDAQ